MFSVVVVPRYSVKIQKGEKAAAVLLQARFALQRCLGLILSLSEALEKAIHRSLVCTQEARFQAKTIHCRNDRLQQQSKFTNKSLHLLVERFFHQVFIQVPNQVNQALLLWTIHRVIGGIEIRNKYSFEILEQRMNQIPFPRSSMTYIISSKFVKAQTYPIPAFRLTLVSSACIRRPLVNFLI